MLYNKHVDPVNRHIDAQGFLIEDRTREGRFASYLNPCDCRYWVNQNAPFGFLI